MSDLISGAIWQFVSFIVIVTAWRLSTRLNAERTLSERILEVSVMSMGIILLGLFIVGGCNLLYSWTAILGVLGVAIAVELIGQQRLENLPRTTVLVEPIPFSNRRQWILGLIWIVVGGFLLGNSVRNGLLRWPHDWDSLMYHMPFIDHWIQDHSLAAMGSARWSMLANSELIGLWFAIPFSGDFLVPISNFPTLVVLGASLYGIARRMGLDEWGASLCAILCVMTPVALMQTSDASNDLMVAAFFFASLNYLGRVSDTKGIGESLLFGVSVGILAGIKYFAVGYALLVIAILVWYTFLARQDWREWLRVWYYVLLGLFLFSSYWYVRNAVLTGNPIYPLLDKAFAERLPYPGIHRTTLLYHVSLSTLDYVLDSVWKKCGLLHTIASVVAPSVALFWMIDRKSSRPKVVGLVWAYLGCAAIMILTPMLVEDQPGTLNHLRWGYTTVRYGLCFWTMNILLLCRMLYFVHRLPREAFRILYRCTIVLIVLFQGYWTVSSIQTLRTDGLVVAGIFSGLWLMTICLTVVTKSSIRVISFFLIVLLHTLGFDYLSARWHDGLAAHFDRYSRSSVFTYCKDNHSGHKDRFLVLDERSYLFFGSRRQNYVVQPMLFYGNDETMKMVKEMNISMIVTRIEEEKKIARYRPAWIDLSNDMRFTELNVPDSSEYRVYRLSTNSE